jgi:hypothetical protein
VDGEEAVRSRHPGASCEKGLRIETLDGTFTVSLPDGASWRTLFSEPRRTERADSFSGLRFEASGGPVRIGSLEVTRDVHYVWGADSPATPKLIPPERLFMAGDNPEISIDSREDAFGLVGTSEVVGLVRLRVWPVGRFGIPK